ncbi:MAG: hypothetical protein K2I74_07300 [Treponemataceae bacterium]|nr:hypothetical protein [Treponemataceae bacterium]
MKTNESLKFERKIRNTIIVDLIFSFLPVLVLIAIKLLTHSSENFFMRSDWSYVSMILYGQTLIKLFSGIIQNMNEKDSSLLILQVSCILAFGLIPSILFLLLIEIGIINFAIIILQFVWLAVSIVIYFIFGGLGLILSEKKKITESDFNCKN